MQAVPVDEPSTEASSLEDSEDEAATSFGIGNSLRSILRSLGCSVFADPTARICHRFVDSDVQFFSHQVITLLCTIFVSLFKQLNFLDEIARLPVPN